MSLPRKFRSNADKAKNAGIVGMNLKLLAWSGLASLSCACGNTVAQLNGQIAKEGKIVIEGTSDDLEGQGNERKEKDPLPVTPPQPVLGSYLAARFEIPGKTSSTECSYLLTEESEFFIGFIEPSAYQMLPVNDISQLKSVSIICSDGISGLEVEALKELNAEERVSLARIVVPFENSPVQSVAAFQATTAFGAVVRGESSGGNSSETKMEFQIVDPEELKNRLIDRK